MRTIIAGSRTVTSYDDLLKAIAAAPWKPTLVISGVAKGVDTLGERWARENDVPLLQMPAQWQKHGKRAGYIRNVEMSKQAEALIAVWDGKSRGTAHMIETMKNLGLPVYVWRVQP